MAPCVRLPSYLMTVNKIKLKAPMSVNKCHMLHTDMAGGDSVDVCDCSTWTPGISCLGDSSDKSRSVYLRAVFMTAFVVYS